MTRTMKTAALIVLLTLMAVIVPAGPTPLYAEPLKVDTPYLSIGVDTGTGGAGQRFPAVLEIFLLMTVLSLAPAILIMLTSFTRIVMVLSLLRQAMGTNQMPPNQVVIGLSLFLTFFVMMPVWENVNQGAIQPYLESRIDQKQALEKAMGPIREFMFRQTKEKDLALFIDIAKAERPRTMADVSTVVLIPAFIISEVKTAFQIGLLLYVPFLIVDMVVASVLLSMGMMMLPPVMISLPFKLMLFVLADGWYLIIGSLIKSFA
ncbi:MAG: flagellar type III secretion system pore protein FliP [Pseudomonadota bacterium]